MKIFLTGGSGFIGTNFVGAALSEGNDLTNFDTTSPLNKDQNPNWVRGNILDKEGVSEAMAAAAPEAVVHMAARADCDENTTVEKGYKENTIGTANVLEAAAALESVKRILVVSTQFVCGPGRLPESDTDYFPHTVYGESKVETEKITRKTASEKIWTIVRPTNVWGPYHQRYAKEFWNIADKGLYLHPDLPTPTRSYGYVGNVVDQILKILVAQEQDVSGKVFYVGDRPVDTIEWIEGFHRALAGRDLRTVPGWVLKSLAYCGDAISWALRRPFYINSSRLRSMTTDYLTPMEKTIATFGEPPCSLEEGIASSVAWFREYKEQGGNSQ